MHRRVVVQISYDQTFHYQFFYWVVSMADAVARLIITVLCAVALNQGTLCQYHSKLAKHRLPCFSIHTHSSYCMLLNALFNQSFVQHELYTTLWLSLHPSSPTCRFLLHNCIIILMVQLVQRKLSSHPYLGLNPI